MLTPRPGDIKVTNDLLRYLSHSDRGPGVQLRAVI